MELDSHANMVVIGAQGTIIQKKGKYADINWFSSDVGIMSRVPIVDAVLAYDCPISGKMIVLWDYAAERRAAIMSLTERELFQLQGSNPCTATFGEEGDILHLCQFAWYE